MASPAAEHIEENLPMKKFPQNSIPAADAQAAKVCFVCKKPIADEIHIRFYRLPQKTDMTLDPHTTQILLCSSACAFRYFTTLENVTTTNH
jgi:hypothetical protein